MDPTLPNPAPTPPWLNDPTPLDGPTVAGLGGLLTFLMVVLVVMLALSVLCVVAMWRTLSKAGEPGWAAIIPIYNVVVLLRIAARPLGWTVLAFLPVTLAVVDVTNPTLLLTHPALVALLGLVAFACGLTLAIIVGTGLAPRFGYGPVFGVIALGLLPAVGYSIVGFGAARYTPGPTARVRSVA
jgi:hypothetical protein